MKKRTKFIAASLSILIMISGAGIATNHVVGGVTKANYTFEVDGESLSLPSNLLVLSKDNTTYVPLRFLSENLGAKVGYKQGIITIESRPSVTDEEKTYKEKYENSLKEVDLIKKENTELKTKINELENVVTDKNLYRGLPAFVESGDNFKITLSRAEVKGNESVFSITISNGHSRNVYNLNPSETTLLINGATYDVSDYSAKLLSPVAVQGNTLGKSTYDGEISFKGDLSQAVKGSLTFYYTSSNSADKKSMTLFFDLSK